MSEATRVCRTCGEPKPLSAFHIRRDTGKYRNDCGECVTAKALAWRKANSDRDRANQREVKRRRRVDPARAESVAAERERRNAQRRAGPQPASIICERCGRRFDYMRTRRHRSVCDECRAADWAWKKFGLTGPALSDLRDASGGRCAICASENPGGKWNGHLHIDHDHKTGQVRGLLCSPCNTSLGLMADDPARMRAAADYIERASPS